MAGTDHKGFVVTGSHRLGQGRAHIKGSDDGGELEAVPEEAKALETMNEPTEKSVLLIVDDFHTKLPCLPLSHGELVEKHLWRILGSNAEHVKQYVSKEASSDAPLLIDRVEIRDLMSLSDVIEAMQKGIDRHPDRRSVVNMSWVLIPDHLLKCVADADAFFNNEEYVNAFAKQPKGQRLKDFFYEKYIESVLHYSSAEEAKVMSELTATNGQEPEILNGAGAIFVAAAGNQRLPKYPLYPGKWKTVVAVSSSTLDGTTPSSFSNPGHFMAPGASFKMSLDGQEIHYEGTSFAAPYVSAKLAWDSRLANDIRARQQLAYSNKPWLLMDSKGMG